MLDQTPRPPLESSQSEPLYKYALLSPNTYYNLAPLPPDGFARLLALDGHLVVLPLQLVVLQDIGHLPTKKEKRRDANVNEVGVVSSALTILFSLRKKRRPLKAHQG